MPARSNDRPCGRIDLPGQLDMPGTEANPAALAQRLAAMPMRPTKAQKPCDHGLFDDTQTQIDLEDMLG